MMFWGLMYDVVGITLIVVITIFVYKIFVESKDSRQGIARPA